jgi:hypothetical protein
MRNARIALWMLMGIASPAFAQLSIDFNVPGANIGIDLPLYPQLQRVPGYPVYYAPGMNSNYFFYDGLYWVYQGDNWYASSWYNGPWGLVDPMDVPVFVLRVPVRYYREAPVYFHGWQQNDAPRWGDHWGQSWEKSRNGWDQWNHKSAPAPAPLPTYQRQYSGNKYPQATQQATIQNQNYRYQPTDAVARQHFQQVRAQAPQQQQHAPQQQAEHKAPQPAPAHEQQATKPAQQPEHKPQPKPAVRQEPAPHPQPQEKGPPPGRQQQGKEQQGKEPPKEQGKEHGGEQGKEKDNPR